MNNYELIKEATEKIAGAGAVFSRLGRVAKKGVGAGRSAGAYVGRLGKKEIGRAHV